MFEYVISSIWFQIFTRNEVILRFKNWEQYQKSESCIFTLKFGS